MWRRWLDNRAAWTALMASILILGGVWTWQGQQPDVEGAQTTRAIPRAGFAAPDLTLETLDGETRTLSDLQGQVVIVNLWATWCPPCRAEMPALERVWQEYRDDGLLVLAINQRESVNRVRAFVDELGLTFPVLLDRDGAVGFRYQLRAYPTTFFIDRDGIIRDVVLGGPMSEALIASKVSELISQATGVEE